MNGLKEDSKLVERDGSVSLWSMVPEGDGNERARLKGAWHDDEQILG